MSLRFASGHAATRVGAVALGRKRGRRGPYPDRDRMNGALVPWRWRKARSVAKRPVWAAGFCAFCSVWSLWCLSGECGSSGCGELLWSTVWFLGWWCGGGAPGRPGCRPGPGSVVVNGGPCSWPRVLQALPSPPRRRSPATSPPSEFTAVPWMTAPVVPAPADAAALGLRIMTSSSGLNGLQRDPRICRGCPVWPGAIRKCQDILRSIPPFDATPNM